MANTKPEDAITQEELEGTTSTSTKPKNAFSELMSHKRKASSDMSSQSAPHKRNPSSIPADAASNAIHGRNALLEYVQTPERFPASRVISHDADFVVIHDLYPKSTVHILLLPRDLTKYTLHPFDAFADPTFLSLVRTKALSLRSLAASELRRHYTRFSTLDIARNTALDASPPPDELPPGRDWASEILIGVHAHPSMTHLHIHIISKDRVSECMRHKKHYNSFATPFLVPIEDFPLDEGDVRRHPGREGWLESDLVCWRCGRGFGSKFKELKGHLEGEMEVWKRL